MKKMHWEQLPKWGKEGRGVKGTVNWRECIGELCEFEYNDIKGTIEIVDYKSEGQKLYVKYLNNRDIINTNNFRSCNIGVLIGERNKEHIYKIGEIINDKLEITKQLLPSKTTSREYECKCIECGFNSDMEYYKNGVLQTKRWRITEGHLKEGNSCPCCSKSHQVTVTNINSMWKTDHWMIKLGVDEEFAKRHTSQSNKTALVRCPDCGREKYKKINNLYNSKTIGCICGDGFKYPEKFMGNVLTQLNISFVSQLSKNHNGWCNNYRYDFLIDNNIIIETNGCQHYENAKCFLLSLGEVQENDRLKKELALNNGIKEYIVIDCRYSELDFIRNNILKSRLSELYDLSNIDWVKCGEYAMSNISKKACDIYNENNGNLNSEEIADILNVQKGTIVIWLKKWNSLGLCGYDPKEASKNGSRKAGKSKGKPIEILKDGVILGVFESCSELERQSEKLFGVKLNHANISSVINGKRSHHKGYTYRYLD